LKRLLIFAGIFQIGVLVSSFSVLSQDNSEISLTSLISPRGISYEEMEGRLIDEGPDVFGPITENCAITDRNPWLGQSWKISGGGDLLDPSLIHFVPPSSLARIPSNYAAQADWNQFASLTSITPSSTESVAIVVVDNFDPNEPLPHGQLVTGHINNILSTGPHNMITVYPVDVGDFESTAVIATEMSAAHQRLVDAGIDRIVFNMSFGVVPCTIARDFESLLTANIVYSFGEYVEQVSSNYANQTGRDINDIRNAVRNVLLRPIDPSSDPLYSNFIKELSGNQFIYFVSSSGNFGLDFPLYPGAWTEVIAVSAYKANNPATLWTEDIDIGGNIATLRASNMGEVMELGAWYEYIDPPGNRTGTYYAGTSFAAPVVSLFLASILTDTTPLYDLHPFSACTTTWHNYPAEDLIVLPTPSGC
jgi:hypothetical protein